MVILIAILVTIFDFWIQIHGVKKFGGGKKAVNGSIVGLIFGIIIYTRNWDNYRSLYLAFLGGKWRGKI